MLEEWEKLHAIHYDRECDNFVVNYSKSIVNTTCLLECKELYKIKFAYHMSPEYKLGHQIYEKIHSNFTGETFITLHKGIYPNVQTYQIDDIYNTKKLETGSSKIKNLKSNKELSNIIQKTIISLYRFNQAYSTNFYKNDIKLLREYLDIFDNQILDIDLQSL